MTGASAARVDWRAATAYVLVAYALMWLVCLPLWVTGHGLDTPGALVIIGVGMWSPALASWLVCRFLTHTPWLARVGLRSGVLFRAVARLAVAGFGLVTASMVIATVLGGMTGLADLDVVGLSGARRLLTGLPPVTSMPPPVVLVAVGVAGTVIASFTVNAAVALGEEVGWRGYLVPALLPLGRARAVILTGVIWAGWHAPIVLLGYDYAGSGRGVALVALAGFTIVVGTLLAWLRVRADSARRRRPRCDQRMDAHVPHVRRRRSPRPVADRLPDGRHRAAHFRGTSPLVASPTMDTHPAEAGLRCTPTRRTISGVAGAYLPGSTRSV